jgi:hypothetical protein
MVWGGSRRYNYLNSGSRYCACEGSTTTVYQDLDGDGHGDSSVPLYVCAPPPHSAPAGGDCSDADENVWGAPSEARSLEFAHPAALSWLAPVDPGATSNSYDLLRSPDAGDFVTNAVCLPVDSGTLTAVDADTPPLGGLFYYLVRAENDCPGAVGTLGTDSAGVPRIGRTCP